VVAIYIIGHSAWLAEATGQLGRAATMFGAYDALLERLERSSLRGLVQAPLLASQERARARLGELAFSAAYASGQQLGFDKAVATAREFMGAPPLDESGRPPPLGVPLPAQ
jgi:hypothetical protein